MFQNHLFPQKPSKQQNQINDPDNVEMEDLTKNSKKQPESKKSEQNEEPQNESKNSEGSKKENPNYQQNAEEIDTNSLGYQINEYGKAMNSFGMDMPMSMNNISLDQNNSSILSNQAVIGSSDNKPQNPNDYSQISQVKLGKDFSFSQSKSKSKSKTKSKKKFENNLVICHMENPLEGMNLIPNVQNAEQQTDPEESRVQVVLREIASQQEIEISIQGTVKETEDESVEAVQPLDLHTEQQMELQFEGRHVDLMTDPQMHFCIEGEEKEEEEPPEFEIEKVFDIKISPKKKKQVMKTVRPNRFTLERAYEPPEAPELSSESVFSLTIENHPKEDKKKKSKKENEKSKKSKKNKQQVKYTFDWDNDTCANIPVTQNQPERFREFLPLMVSRSRENRKKLANYIGRIEEKNLDISGLTSKPIKFKNLEPDTYGMNISGTGEILLNKRYLNNMHSDDYNMDLLETVSHEMQHRYDNSNLARMIDNMVDFRSLSEEEKIKMIP